MSYYGGGDSQPPLECAQPAPTRGPARCLMGPGGTLASAPLRGPILPVWDVQCVQEAGEGPAGALSPELAL